MKTTVIIVALFVTCVAGEFDFSQFEVFKQAKAIYDKCVESMKPSEEALKNLMAGEGQDHEETNCMRACFMKEGGMMKDKKFDLSKIEEMINSNVILQSKPEIKDAIVGVLKGCYKTGESAANECEMAGNVSKCFKSIADRIKAVIVEAAAAGA